MLILMLTTIVATSIIVSVFYEKHVNDLNDRIHVLERDKKQLCEELAQTQWICDLGWTDCLCRPGVVDPNCAFLKAQQAKS